EGELIGVGLVGPQPDDERASLVGQAKDGLLGREIGHHGHDRTVARVLLLLPTATYRAPDFLSAARRLGVEVVVASEEAQTMAVAMGDRALVVDLTDPEAAVAVIVDLHARAPLDGVVAVDEQGVVVAALVGEKLGLAHNPVEAVRATRDKALMRTALAA